VLKAFPREIIYQILQRNTTYLISLCWLCAIWQFANISCGDLAFTAKGLDFASLDDYSNGGIQSLFKTASASRRAPQFF
jgi:hypothetical protein